jgi:hypothetical protein
MGVVPPYHIAENPDVAIGIDVHSIVDEIPSA